MIDPASQDTALRHESEPSNEGTAQPSSPRNEQSLSVQDCGGFALEQLTAIVQAALFASGQVLSGAQLQQLFEPEQQPSMVAIDCALHRLQQLLQGQGIELLKVASGYRLQTQAALAPWVMRLWDEKPTRYSRALLETLALIAYRQPITRGEIEQVRGVAVSTGLIKTLQERSWIRVVGHRDVPGRPALYATTQTFLDYFALQSLDELPALSELKDLDALNPELLFDSDQSDTLTDEPVPAEMAETAPQPSYLDQALQEDLATIDRINATFQANMQAQKHRAEQAIDDQPCASMSDDSAEPNWTAVTEPPASPAQTPLTEAEQLSIIQQKLAQQARRLAQSETEHTTSAELEHE